LDIPDLKAFQVEVSYDKSIKPVSVKAGPDWKSNMFESTLDDPTGKILLIGSDPDATLKSATVAVVTFQYLNKRPKPPTGIIVETLVTNGVMHGQRERSITAAVSAGSVKDKSIKCDGAPVPGDANADCRFTVSDLFFIQRYRKGISLGASQAQKKAMDADCNGNIEERDVYFIRRALARKFRLIVTKPAVVISSCNLQVSTSLWNKDTKAADVVLEVTLGQTPKKTVRMNGNKQGDSTKYTASVLVKNTDKVHINFHVKTSDENGRTDDTRLFRWQGLIDGVPGSDQPKALFDRQVKDSECAEVTTQQPKPDPTGDKSVILGLETTKSGTGSNNQAAKSTGSSKGGFIAAAVMLGLLLVAAVVVVILYVMGLFCFAGCHKFELLVIVPRGSSVHDGHSLDENGRLRVEISDSAKVDEVADAIIDAFRDLPVSVKEKKNHQYPFSLRQVTFSGKGTMSVVPVDGHGFALLPFDQTLEDLHIHAHAILELVGLTNIMFIVPPNCDVKQHRSIDNSIDDHPRISLVTSPTMDIAMLKDHIKDAVDGLPKTFDIAIWPGDDKHEAEAKKLPGRGSSLQELEIGNATTVMMIKYRPDVQVLTEGYTEEL